MLERDLAECDPRARSVFTPPGDTRPAQPAWYALRIRSRAEFVVRDRLSEAGIDNFLPTFEEVSVWSDRSTIVTRPLFGGYIFIKTDPAALHIPRRIAGVVQVLGSTSMLAEMIPEREIASLRLALAARVPVAPHAYVVGARVRVERGPLAGAEGVVVRSKGSTRLVLLVEMLKSAVSVEVDAADLRESKQ